VFYTYFYNHAHRIRLEKLLYMGLSKSPNGFSILGPGGRFTSKTAARLFRNFNGGYITASEAKRLQICTGNGYYIFNGHSVHIPQREKASARV
jgi:hypothetical protein